MLPQFKRGAPLYAVRPIVFAGVEYGPGDEVPRNVPSATLEHFYRIGGLTHALVAALDIVVENRSEAATEAATEAEDAEGDSEDAEDDDEAGAVTTVEARPAGEKKRKKRRGQ